MSTWKNRLNDLRLNPLELTVWLAGLLAWLVGLLDWQFTQQLPAAVHWATFSLGLLMTLRALQWAFWPARRSKPAQRVIFTVAYLVIWQTLTFLGPQFWPELTPFVAQLGTGGLFVLGLCWVILALESSARRRPELPETELPDLGPDLRNLLLWAVLFPPGLIVWGRNKRRPLRQLALFWLGIWTLLAGTIFYATRLWSEEALTALGTEATLGNVLLLSLAGSLSPLLELLLMAGSARPLEILQLPLIAWNVLGFLGQEGEEAAQLAAQARQQLGGQLTVMLLTAVALAVVVPLLTRWWWNRARQTEPGYIWNPLHPQAWYYGKRQPRLNQSVTAFSGYSGLFLVGVLIMTNLGGCEEIYEMPAGGGEPEQLVQVVQVQKIIKKKFIINPFSQISLKVPEIDDVKLNLNEATKHTYTVGYGQGTGAGFSGGTNLGKVRFIRLEYAGGDWNQDFGVGADLNMLLQYGIRTNQKIQEQTESRTVAALANFPKGKSPPFVFMTGQRNITLSRSEVRILREYLTDKHGMLFCDNGGSGHFHNQFVSMMREVLPNVRPVPVPLDDRIHRVPYQIPFLPYVAPHGGKEALGWKVEGRWVAYYHPGDIGDAWSDGHSGVKPEVYEACYQLGTNVIFYAHLEYSKWLEAQQQGDKAK